MAMKLGDAAARASAQEPLVSAMKPGEQLGKPWQRRRCRRSLTRCPCTAQDGLRGNKRASVN